MSSDAKRATARPWRYFRDGHCRFVLTTGMGSCTFNLAKGEVRDEATAALIVRAVNTFDKAREAALTAQDFILHYPNMKLGDRLAGRAAVLRTLRAVLAEMDATSPDDNPTSPPEPAKRVKTR